MAEGKTLPDDPLHSPKEVAKRYDITENTLGIWRHRGVGPKYLRISRRCIRYRESALRDHEKSCEVA